MKYNVLNKKVFCVNETDFALCHKMSAFWLSFGFVKKSVTI